MWLGKLTTLDMTPPASMAQLDARWTDDQEVASSNPARLATFFRVDLIM